MRVAVIGGTGGAGLAILPEVLQAGHEVVAVARRPGAIPLRHERLRMVTGDVYDAEALARAFEGCDAVISALGRGGMMQARKPSNLLERGTGNIIAAMERGGIERLIAVSSVGVEDDPTEEIVYRYIIKKILRQLYEDMARMEAGVRSSQLAWTLLRPPFLTDGVLTGRYCMSPDGNVPHGRRLSRKDLAQFAVLQLGSAEFVRRVVGISYPTRRTPATVVSFEMATISRSPPQRP